MKNIRKHIILVFALSLSLTSCKKFSEFGDTNVDQTKVDKAATRALLTYAMQKSQARGDQNTAATTTLSTTGAIFGQFISEGPYLTVSPFNDAGSTLNPSYYTFYSEILKNLNSVIDFAEANAPEAEAGANGSLNNQIAVARIMKAYTFWKITDRWGDLPYEEALNSANITPKFTKQEDIYKDLFKELKEAVAQMDDGDGPVGDIMLGGDMDTWKKFAATQRLLMALRLSKVYPNAGEFAATEFNSALTDGPIAANETLEYTFLAGDPNNLNPWYSNYSIANRNDFAISNTLVDLMENNGTGTDPRLPIYGETLAGNQVVGLEFGTTVQTNIPNSFSRIGNTLRAAGSPAYIFTGAQVEFAQAEAAKRGWISGGDAVAKTHYDAGIDASLEQYGVADATFKDATNIAYDPANAIEQISVQRYIALYLDGWEAWSEFRRTGFPALVPGPNSQNGAVIPRRIGYPTADQTTNATNYNAALAAQGWANNGINNRMWWDKP